MIILGLMAFGLNPSACLLIDGQVIAMVEEERLNRQKGANNCFPAKAIMYCLERAGLTLQDVHVIAVGRNPARYLSGVPWRYVQTWLNYRKNLHTARWELQQLRTLNPIAAQHWLRSHLQTLAGNTKLPPIEFVGHHQCHAATAAYLSGLSEAAILTCDGHGDDDCTVLWSFRNGKLQVLERYPIPESLGWFYSAFTGLFGFKKNFDEGKLMGLAAYGHPTDQWSEAVDRVLSWQGDHYHVDMSYIWYGPIDAQTGIAQRMLQTFGPPRAGRNAAFTQDDQNLAYAVQDVFERMLQKLAQRALTLAHTENLAVAGGCALNCKANGTLARLPQVRQFWVQPVSSDAGCSLGAALVVAAEHAEKAPHEVPLETIYWGPCFSNENIEHVLQTSSLNYQRCDDIAKQAATALAAGKVVGWFQGAMEAGPRALGGRSILADPTRQDAQDRVNLIKQRETWRPFCPTILAEFAQKYVQDQQDTPFMIVAQEARPGVEQLIPSVIHVDGSMRPQYVTQQRNQRFYHLIQELGLQTGQPVVLNTSFNVQGEPIVCSPADAVRTFCHSQLDILAIENYWVEK